MNFMRMTQNRDNTCELEVSLKEEDLGNPNEFDLTKAQHLAAQALLFVGFKAPTEVTDFDLCYRKNKRMTEITLWVFYV